MHSDVFWEISLLRQLFPAVPEQRLYISVWKYCRGYRFPLPLFLPQTHCTHKCSVKDKCNWQIFADIRCRNSHWSCKYPKSNCHPPCCYNMDCHHNCHPASGEEEGVPLLVRCCISVPKLFKTSEDLGSLGSPLSCPWASHGKPGAISLCGPYLFFHLFSLCLNSSASPSWRRWQTLGPWSICMQ